MSEKELEQKIEDLELVIKGLKERYFEEAIDRKFPAAKVCDVYYAASTALKILNKPRYEKLFEQWEKDGL